jgi:hypothetical protein
MEKAGEKRKPKKKPKIEDAKQSERFKEAARALGADEDDGALDLVIKQLASAKPPKK